MSGRIRNIKPEYWDDEDVSRCCRDARLLGIGLWNFADKAGRLRDSAAWVRAKVFPYDADVTNELVDGWLGELEHVGFIQRYQAGGRALIQVVNFVKHQYLSKREQETDLPGPDKSQTSPVPVSAETEPGTTDKGHRTGDIGQGTTVQAGANAPPLPADLMAVWNATVTRLPPCTEMSPDRDRHAKARLRQHPDLDSWREAIRHLDASDFASGENDRGWVANIDFLLKAGTLAKIREGRYDNRARAPTSRFNDVSARELEAARQHRSRVHGRCPHEPPCHEAAECIHHIALELRGAVHA
jgi:hypothetical protein